jgi:hypothetical protein
MTFRTTAKDTGRRAQTSCSRCTLQDFDDDHDMMQIKKADVYTSDTPSDFERWQQAGTTVHPMPQEKEQQGQQGQQGGGDGGGQDGGDGGENPWNKKQSKQPAAEGIMLYLNGSRSHPVCVSADDRRHRPLQTKAGESLFYAADGHGSTLYHRRRQDGKDGVYLITCDGNDEQQQGGAGGQASQQKTERTIRIGHVNKKRQNRKSKKLQEKQQQQFGIETFAGQDGQQEFKHEGDSVNTEQRFTSKQIQYYDGSTNVGHYDKSNKDWLHHDGQGHTHSMRADKNHSHIKHDGNHIWVDKGNCYSSKPIQIQADTCS